MYVPECFRLDDSEEINTFLQQNSFGTVITSGDVEILATHLPFVIERNKDTFILESHLALKNNQSKFIRQGKQVLVTFLGPTGYISSSVYSHPNAPTYNYQSIHVYGTIQPLTHEELVHHLTKLVDTHEGSRCPSLDMKSMPTELLESYYKEIVGFRIESYKVVAANKLSQNRNDADFNAILNDLSSDQQNTLLIEAMKRTRK